MSAHPYDHGHTVAGWTGFAIAAAGTAVVGAGICLVSVPLLIGGALVALIGLVVTWVLHLAGWGKPSGPRPRDQWDWRVRDTSAREGHAGCLGCRLAGRGRVPMREAAPRDAVPAPRAEAGARTVEAGRSVS
ncbi:hypothetical protein GCM10010297_36000 [Streptomyces malachitofuscus]|nr:hypothetical protein GCM10010297_36000 [Streptomyces malachitofuscus]